MDDIWRNAARKVHERAQQTTTATANATTATTTDSITATSDFLRPPEKLRQLWQKTAKRAAKKAYQTNFIKTGQSLDTPLAEVNRAIIDRATKDAITANTSIEQHDARLRELERAWCREKITLFPEHVRDTFAAVRIRLEARDTKHAR